MFQRRTSRPGPPPAPYAGRLASCHHTRLGQLCWHGSSGGLKAGSTQRILPLGSGSARWLGLLGRGVRFDLGDKRPGFPKLSGR